MVKSKTFKPGEFIFDKKTKNIYKILSVKKNLEVSSDVEYFCVLFADCIQKKQDMKSCFFNVSHAVGLLECDIKPAKQAIYEQLKELDKKKNELLSLLNDLYQEEEKQVLLC